MAHEMDLVDQGDLLAALPVAVFSLHFGQTPVSRNRAAAELAAGRVGASLVEMLGLTGRGGARGPACPLALGLDGQEVSGARFTAHRGDGAPIAVVISTRVQRDHDGRPTRVVAIVAEDSGTAGEAVDRARLAAIVASSHDAIVSKTLEGRITSWNSSAERIFGYSAQEMLGESILRIIPPEFHDEEQSILDRLRRGERVEHFDTVRIARDGRRVDISLTISPLRDATGTVVGASKIARDVTARKRTERLQAKLFDELTHRVNNALATMQSIAMLSLSGSVEPARFVASFTGRLRALGVAHDLLVRSRLQGADLRELVQAITEPDTGPDIAQQAAVRVSGEDVVLDPRLVVPLALALNELAMGGAGSETDVRWRLRCDAALELEWQETPRSGAAATDDRRAMAVIERMLDGVDATVRVDDRPDMFAARMVLPLPQDRLRPETRPDVGGEVAAAPGVRRVLVVEDEALIAMDIEAQLAAAGWDVVGPAGTIDEALALIAETRLDAALVDANVRGRPVGEIAEALQARGVPFAFATGYGRSALPAGFRDVPLLAKPFASDHLIATVAALLDPVSPRA
ncbi:MAG: PAS domain S-box protein [Amaricoccus sp.]|uniref:PAS domain S-box protein n=1 Tax=Amaricoccus sp. TaxID=1872485 RepID=UPI0039E45B50